MGGRPRPHRARHHRGASVLEANERQPLLTITTGDDNVGNVKLPVVEGDLRFRDQTTPL